MTLRDEKPQPISFDVRNTALAVGLSVDTIGTAIKKGLLTAHYSGTKPLILVEDAREFVKNLPTERPERN